MEQTNTLEDLANERANGSPSQKIAWTTALQSLPTLSPEKLCLLGKEMASPELARILGRFLGRESDPETALDQFFREVDESEEPLEEWFKALEVLSYFLESTPHRPSLGQALGYLHCSVAMAHTGSSFTTFPLTVETMLETYGFDGQAS